MSQSETAVLDVLCDAWARIEDPAHWTTNAYALDAGGMRVETRDSEAVRWCAMGSVLAVPNNEVLSDAVDLLGRANAHLYTGSITRVNDRFGHRAVERVYALAAAYAYEWVEP